MIIGTRKNNIFYEDITHGRYGFFVWGIPAAFLFFLYINCIAMLLLIETKPSLTEDYLMIFFGFFAILAVVIWFGASTLYISQTVQRVSYNEQDIFIRLYFGQKRTFYLDELVNIRNFKIHKLMSQTDTFPVGGIGFFIEFRNGKRYRVSPNMQGFLNLKQVLIDIIHKEDPILIAQIRS